jgi:hypothetical protein
LTHRLDKVFTGLDRVDVTVDTLFAKMLGEAIIQAPGMTDAVFAAVTNKD